MEKNLFILNHLSHIFLSLYNKKSRFPILNIRFCVLNIIQFIFITQKLAKTSFFILILFQIGATITKN